MNTTDIKKLITEVLVIDKTRGLALQTIADELNPALNTTGTNRDNLPEYAREFIEDYFNRLDTILRNKFGAFVSDQESFLKYKNSVDAYYKELLKKAGIQYPDNDLPDLRGSEEVTLDIPLPTPRRSGTARSHELIVQRSNDVIPLVQQTAPPIKGLIRTSKPSYQVVIDELNEVIRPSREYDAMMEEAFKIYCGFPLKKPLTGKKLKLYNSCSLELEDIIGNILRNESVFDETFFDILRECVLNAAVYLLPYVRPVRDTAMIELMRFLGYITPEMVVRIKDGNAYVPNRSDEIIRLTSEQIDEIGFNDIMDFTNTLLADTIQSRERIKRIYDEKIRPRYQDPVNGLGWSKETVDRQYDILLNTLLTDTAIDIVRERSNQCNGESILHARRGLSHPERGKGVWMGEGFIRHIIRMSDCEDFFIESVIEEAQHFELSGLDHRFTLEDFIRDNQGTTCMKDLKYIYHGESFDEKTSAIFHQFNEDVEDQKRAYEKSAPRLVSFSTIKKHAPNTFEPSLLPKREGKTGEDLLIEKTTEIIEGWNEEYDFDDIDYLEIREFIDDVIMIFLNIPFKHWAKSHYALVQKLYRLLKLHVEIMYELGVTSKRIQNIRIKIISAAAEMLVMEQPGNLTMADVLLFLNYIDCDMALRFAPKPGEHSNEIIIPDRLDDPADPSTRRILDQETIREQGFDTINNFINHAKYGTITAKKNIAINNAKVVSQGNNIDALWYVFWDKIAPRYAEILKWDTNQIKELGTKMITTLRTRASIDLVRQRASFCHGQLAMHPRRGVSGRAPGIWIGELTLRLLIHQDEETQRNEGLLFFTQFMLEEAQHFESPSPLFHHAFVKQEDGTTNYGAVVHHDMKFWNKLEILTLDIENFMREEHEIISEEEQEKNKLFEAAHELLLNELGWNAPELHILPTKENSSKKSPVNTVVNA